MSNDNTSQRTPRSFRLPPFIMDRRGSLIIVCVLVALLIVVVANGPQPSTTTKATAAPISQQVAFHKWVSAHAGTTPVFEINSWKKGDEKLVLETYADTGAAIATTTVNVKTFRSVGPVPKVSDDVWNRLVAVQGGRSVSASGSFYAAGFGIMGVDDSYVTHCGLLNVGKFKGEAGGEHPIYSVDTPPAIQGSACGEFALVVRWAK